MAEEAGKTGSTEGSESRSENASVVTSQQTEGAAAQVGNENLEGSQTIEVEPAWNDMVVGIDKFSEADLTGTDPDAADDTKTGAEGQTATDGEKTAAASEPGADDKEATDKGDSDGKTADASGDDPNVNTGDVTPAKTGAEGDGDTPGKTGEEAEPAGYVKIAALHQARGENRHLKSQIAELQTQVTEAKVTGSADSKPDWYEDFSVLETAELEALAEDSAPDAAEYIGRLAKYTEIQTAETKALAEANEAAEKNGIEVGVAFERIETAIPGLLDDDGVHDGVYNFATAIGFDDQMLALTNPNNTISINGEAPVPLGNIAAGMVELLANLQSSVEAQFGTGKPTPAAANTDDVAGTGGEQPAVDVEALTKQITEQVTAQLKGKVLDKLKETGGSQQFASLSEVSNSGNEEFGEGSTLTMDQIQKLTPEQQQAYLSGTPT